MGEFQDDVSELKGKWSRLCKNLHQGKPTQRQISSVVCNEYNSSGKNYSLYPWWPNQKSIITDCKSISFSDPPNVKPNQGASTVPRFRRQQSCHIEFSFSNGNSKNQSSSVEPNLDSLKNRQGKEVKITLALGNSQLSDIGGNVDEEMLKMLQENLPWQMENMHTIVDALMDFNTINKQKNWLLIEGNDSIGKQRFARVIAKSAFGSDDFLLCINIRNMSNHVELLNKALRNNEKLVVLLEDVDFADAELLKFLMDVYENWSSSHLFILAITTSDATDDGREYYCTEPVIQMKLVVSETSLNPGLVCIDHKRKAEWELSSPNKTKSPRNNVMEDVSSIAAQSGKIMKEFTRQLSSNTLDLNIKADEGDEIEAKTEDFSPISSDLTRDTANDQHQQNNNPPLGFLDLIKNRLVLKRDSSQDKQMREVFMFKMRRSLEDVCGSKILERFSLDEMVLEKVFEGCGSFLNSLFDEWLKDIFQTSLQMIDEKENIVIIKLCEVVRAKDETGFKGSCLPRGIQVSIMD